MEIKLLEDHIDILKRKLKISWMDLEQQKQEYEKKIEKIKEDVQEKHNFLIRQLMQ